jgi:plastocyanin
MLASLLRPARPLVLAAVLILAGTVQARTETATPPNTIVIKDFDFSPMALTIKAGTTVTWRNRDEEPHTVTSTDGLFHSGGLDEDDTYSYTFAKPGTYHYQCSIHPRMQATIVVQ